MAMLPSEVMINDFGDHVLTVKIKPTKRLKARMFIASMLLRLTAFVLGAGYKEETNE